MRKHADSELRALYGEQAVISRKDGFVLVHLDSPSGQTVRERTRQFDPGTYFCEGCPLCDLLKAGGVIVFDESSELGGLT